jgi:poly-gamma-glutamate capsule biosynthesis protein CapA/YwtB (metallophosphatase superfamily)
VVAGHHSHDAQAAARIGGTVVLYSLGNYMFGSHGPEAMRVGLIARLTVQPRRGDAPARLVGVELVPILANNAMSRFQPRPLEAGELWWLDDLVEESRRRGAPLIQGDTTFRLEL